MRRFDDAVKSVSRYTVLLWESADGRRNDRLALLH